MEEELKSSFPIEMINCPTVEKKEVVQISGNAKTSISIKIQKGESNFT